MVDKKEIEKDLDFFVYVSDKKTGKVIKVNTTKERDWKEKYNHRLGMPFEKEEK